MQKLKHHLVGFGAGVATILLVMPSLSLADLGLTLSSFSNGDVADANAVNSNFTQLTDSANGLDSRIGALESKVPASCTEGQVLVWSDSSGAWACGAAADVTSDNETVCTDAGGTWDSGSSTCGAAADVTSDNETVCTDAGGTWDSGSSTCSPPLNCFASGFCHEANARFSTNLPNARFGPATELQCTSAGQLQVFEFGTLEASAQPSLMHIQLLIYMCDY